MISITDTTSTNAMGLPLHAKIYLNSPMLHFFNVIELFESSIVWGTSGLTVTLF